MGAIGRDRGEALGVRGEGSPPAQRGGPVESHRWRAILVATGGGGGVLP